MSTGLTSPVAQPTEPYLTSRQPTSTSKAPTTKDTFVHSLPRGARVQKGKEIGNAHCLTTAEHHLQRILLGHAQHRKHGTQDGRQKGNHVKCCKREAVTGLQAQPASRLPSPGDLEGTHSLGMSPEPQVILRGPPELLRDIEGPESLWHLPLDTERLASVCNTEE